jgi:hypothetical protein
MRKFLILFLIYFTTSVFSQETIPDSIKTENSYIVLPSIYITRESLNIDEKNGFLESKNSYKSAYLFKNKCEYKNFIKENIDKVFEDDSIKGIVRISFVIGKDGLPQNIKVLDKITVDTDRIGRSLIIKMRPWFPAYNINNKAIRTYVFLNIYYNIEERREKQKKYKTNLNDKINEGKNNIKKPKKDTATIILPDLLIKRDTIIVTNDNNGSLQSIGSKIPAIYFKDIQEYVQYFIKYFDVDFSDEETKGDLLLSFIIDKDGTPTNIQIVNALTKDANMESIRVLKRMKKWQPAMSRKRKPIRTAGYLKIHFDIKALPKKKPLINSVQTIIKHSCN